MSKDLEMRSLAAALTRIEVAKHAVEQRMLAAKRGRAFPGVEAGSLAGHLAFVFAHLDEDETEGARTLNTMWMPGMQPISPRRRAVEPPPVGAGEEGEHSDSDTGGATVVVKGRVPKKRRLSEREACLTAVRCENPEKKPKEPKDADLGSSDEAEQEKKLSSSRKRRLPQLDLGRGGLKPVPPEMVEITLSAADPSGRLMDQTRITQRDMKEILQARLLHDAEVWPYALQRLEKPIIGQRTEDWLLTGKKMVDALSKPRGPLEEQQFSLKGALRIVAENLVVNAGQGKQQARLLEELSVASLDPLAAGFSKDSLAGGHTVSTLGPPKFSIGGTSSIAAGDSRYSAGSSARLEELARPHANRWANVLLDYSLQATPGLTAAQEDLEPKVLGSARGVAGEARFREWRKRYQNPSIQPVVPQAILRGQKD